MSYIEHAKREFTALGYKPIEECEDDPNKWIQENILELLEVFSKQGHSGSSAPYCINLFKKLASFEPLAPLTFKDDEWNEIDTNVYQNNRMSSVFKDDKNGKPYYLYAIVMETQTGDRWNGTAKLPDKYSGSNKTIGCAQYIDTSKPFEPKTFVLKVKEVEVAKDDWEFYVDDVSQLTEIFNYYKKKDI